MDVAVSFPSIFIPFAFALEFLALGQFSICNIYHGKPETCRRPACQS
jgi:hypothetical protein